MKAISFFEISFWYSLCFWKFSAISLKNLSFYSLSQSQSKWNFSWKDSIVRQLKVKDDLSQEEAKIWTKIFPITHEKINVKCLINVSGHHKAQIIFKTWKINLKLIFWNDAIFQLETSVQGIIFPERAANFPRYIRQIPIRLYLGKSSDENSIWGSTALLPINPRDVGWICFCFQISINFYLLPLQSLYELMVFKVNWAC